MKKLMNLWLLAALVCGLSLSVTSCKDDDDDNKSEEQQQQEQEAKASKFWSVVGQLVSSDSYTADYQDKTFEPTYGVAESDGSLTRIVETNDMQTAASYFADLISVVDGSAIDEDTPTYTYSDPEVGTLTYTRGGTEAEWATVDVNIKQVPRLRKIIYRQGGEGTNGDFAGKAYYRFGDVVSRTLDNGKVEYWICVRPAFGPEKKSDSHWVCLNHLPAKNFFNYAYQSKSWTVPTGIGTNKKNMQNLAEMLYAIVRPEEWYKNANNLHTDGKLWGFSGMPIFNDFKKANVMYHNQYFWQKVAKAWEKHKITENAMNVEQGDLADRIDRHGIHLLYNGYSWWTKTSWNCTLYEASYTNGQKNEEKNLHHDEYKEIKKNMEDIKFDCTLMGATTERYMQFFDNDGKYRWVVRHATGADLNGGVDPSPTAPLQGAGVKTVYRYYDEYEAEWLRKGPNGKSGTPEVAVADAEPQEVVDAEPLAAPKVGCILAADGKFYNTVAEANSKSHALALVAVLNGKKRVENGADWNGLAIMLNRSEAIQWSPQQYDCGVKYVNFVRNAPSCLEGLANTVQYVEGCGKGHNHTAAKEAYKTVIENNANFSKSFLPSVGQWILALKSFEFPWDDVNGYDSQSSSAPVDAFKQKVADVGINYEEAFSKYTWTSTPKMKDEELICMFRFAYSQDVNHTTIFRMCTDKLSVQPFIAFKYAGGATED